MDDFRLSPEQMQNMLMALLVRNFWLTTHVAAHDALLQPIARRQLDYDELLENVVEGTKKRLLSEMLGLGVDETVARYVLAEAARRVLEGPVETEAN